MKQRARLVGPRSALATVLILIVAACGSSDSADPSDAAGGAPVVADRAEATGAAPFVSEPRSAAAAVEAGAAYLEGQYGSIDIASLSLIAYVGTNWDVSTLAAAADAAQERRATAELDPEEAAMVRMADPATIADATLADEFAPGSTTATLARVLRCDEDPLTDADVVALDALVDGGGYDATHAALAIMWLDELGCVVADAAERHQRLVEGIGAELATADEVTDLAVEQSAVLHYLGVGDRVPDDWLDRVLAAQRTDGGWGERVSTWHMTLLAVWTILAETGAGDGAPMVGPTP